MSQSRPGDIFRPGDLLNNTYRIEAVLGRGGISEVYRARSEISGRVVAVKALNREFAQNEAFLVLMTREEEIRDIRHEAIVRYSECQRTPDGHVYLVMDFVDGTGLDARLSDGGMTMRDLLTVGAKVAAGLEAAHGRNIVHRDLSPDNIILRDSDPAQPVIIDFGIAKDATPGAATIVGGRFAGKYAYAAPEQFRGQTDARSDIYSLGALLLATYRGAEPEVSEFPADVIEYKKQPLDTHGVPEPLKTLLDRMVVPDPQARFQSAAEMREAFEAAVDGMTVIKTVAAPPSPPAEAGRRGSRTLLAVLVLLLSAGLGSVFVAWQRGYLYPTVDAFVLRAQDTRDGAPTVEGHVNTPALVERLHAIVARENGSHGLDVVRHRGEVHPEWGDAVAAVLDIALDLEQFSFSVEDHAFHLEGESDSPSHRDRIATRLAAVPLPDGFTLDLDIALPAGRLYPETVQPILDDLGDCGPLHAVNLPTDGLPPGAPLRIAGRVDSSTTRLALADALAAVAGDRPVELSVTEMNPAVCLLLDHLPDVPESPASLVYSFGRTGETNTADRFYTGENPVIDIRLPAEIDDGFLYVVLVDAAGNAARLLPNPFRADNSVAGLRAGASGDTLVRVAYSFAEAQGSTRLTLRVDGSAPGLGMLALLHTDAPILPPPARTSETVEALAAALDAAAASDAGRILSVRTRVLETATN